MSKLFVPFIMILFLAGCGEKEPASDHGHSHDLEPLVHTIYTDHSELFVEFKPLVVGSETRFAAHFTVLGELFTPLERATITLVLATQHGTDSVQATTPEVPGIFRLRLTPKTAGKGSLTFHIQTPEYTDVIVIENVEVYADVHDVPHAHAQVPGDEITYLKEQAWKVEFANAPVLKRPFSEIIKTSGQILSAPGDEQVVSATSSGIALFSGSRAVIGAEVTAGTSLFRITGGNLAENNPDAAYREAEANRDKAKIDFERASLLVADKLISEKEFQDIALRYQHAKSAFETLSSNYAPGGRNITASMGGFVKNILVSEGQFVEAGTPLAIISKNRKLMLQVNMSQRYFSKLSSITSANFQTVDGQKMCSTEHMSGRMISYGRSATDRSPFVPLTFEIDNIGDIIPGSVAEVYLKTAPVSEVLTIPTSALLEEQGHHFVYVQTGGESFQKREVKLGGSDGIMVQVLSGVEEGERVVSEGAYQIKLSSASGTLPAHGHEH